MKNKTEGNTTNGGSNQYKDVDSDAMDTETAQMTNDSNRGVLIRITSPHLHRHTLCPLLLHYYSLCALEKKAQPSKILSYSNYVLLLDLSIPKKQVSVRLTMIVISSRIAFFCFLCFALVTLIKRCHGTKL